MINLEKVFQELYVNYTTISSHKRAEFLEQIALELEEHKAQIIPMACQESNLPEGRITGELGRTINQIRLFVRVLKEGSWVEAVIDRGDANRSPLPKPDIRRMLIALGPVLVFGASNFPLAFSTAGGDSISALAAGCPVIYKAHPAHPQTSRLVAFLIQQAALKVDLPSGVFIHVEGGNEEGQALVKHSLVKAVAFTGSFAGGKALFDLAQQRDEPIPVFAEMGSVNPIVVLDNKLRKEINALAKQFVSSLTLGVGQFCTNPGLLIVPSNQSSEFAELIRQELVEVPPSPMLHSGIASSYFYSLEEFGKRPELEWVQSPSSQDKIKASPAMARIKARDWIKDDIFQNEIFGPAAIMVEYDETAELYTIADALHGQLTLTLWAEEEELLQHKDLIHLLSEKCGRLLFNGVPTGVEVGYAMQHGGPFPATTDSRTTSVGVYALKRFVRPIAYQDMPATLLPEELREDNPLGIWRWVDGDYRR